MHYSPPPFSVCPQQQAGIAVDFQSTNILQIPKETSFPIVGFLIAKACILKHKDNQQAPSKLEPLKKITELS
jgi:hypothetical protein